MGRGAAAADTSPVCLEAEEGAIKNRELVTMHASVSKTRAIIVEPLADPRLERSWPVRGRHVAELTKKKCDEAARAV